MSTTAFERLGEDLVEEFLTKGVEEACFTPYSEHPSTAVPSPLGFAGMDPGLSGYAPAVVAPVTGVNLSPSEPVLHVPIIGAAEFNEQRYYCASREDARDQSSLPPQATEQPISATLGSLEAHETEDQTSQEKTIEPNFPAQVNFYFWLDDFLHLCAQDKYKDAMRIVNQWRRNPGLASRPRWDPLDKDCVEGTCDVELDAFDFDCIEYDEEDEQTEHCRRCLAAYAGAMHQYMIDTKRSRDNNAKDQNEDSWELRPVPGKGRTMVARRTIIAGEEVFVERPLAVLPSDSTALVCPQCLRTIGTPLEQWAQLPLEGRKPLPCEAEGVQADAPALQPEQASVEPPIPCHGKNCKMMFCSAECAKKAWEGHHSLLCGSLLVPDQAEAYEAIVERSKLRGNRHLLLAVHVTADMLSEVLSFQRSEQPYELETIVENHVGKYRSELWEALTKKEEDIAMRTQDIQYIAGLVERLLGPYCDTLPNASTVSELLLAPMALSRCVGMLELVCVKASLLSPLALALSVARKDQQDKDCVSSTMDDAKKSLATFAITSTGRKLSQPTEASAMVPFVAMCNHSCIPNVEVDFRHETERPGVWCSLTATRTIATGEELNIQYMPVVATPFTERQATLLHHWGFQCGCLRCAAESSLSESDSSWFCTGCEAFRATDECSSTESSYLGSDDVIDVDVGPLE